MQIRKSFNALTSLLPSSSILRKLARKSRFVIRSPRKIQPEKLIQSVLLAVCQNTPHFRAIAAAISPDQNNGPSRQAVFERLNNESAPVFFFQVFRQVLAEQNRRFTDRKLSNSLKEAKGLFRRILIEDGSVIPLHHRLAERFRGSVNQHGESAALRLRWAFDYLTGKTVDAELHLWRENDISTAFELLDWVKKGDLILRDMGYFCLKSFHQIIGMGAYFLTRIPEGTVIFDTNGKRVNLASLLRKTREKSQEWEVQVGVENSVPGRLVAMKIDRAKAKERRRRLRQSARAQGKEARRAELEMCDWVVVFTNVEGTLMEAESIAQLYRARWLVEIFFKGMKSGQHLEKWSRHRTNEHTIQCLAYAQLVIGLLSLNLWRVMGQILLEGSSDESEDGRKQLPKNEEELPPTIGALKAMESLVPLFIEVFRGSRKGRAIYDELVRLARYAAHEKRKRPSLDAVVIALLT